MAWNIPYTWTVGEIVTKTLLDTYVRNQQRHLKGLDGIVDIRNGMTMSGSISCNIIAYAGSGVITSMVSTTNINAQVGLIASRVSAATEVRAGSHTLTTKATDPHGIGQHTDVTRTKFIQVSPDLGTTIHAMWANYHTVKLTGGADDIAIATFMCPNDFVSIASFKAVWVSVAATGKMYLQAETDYAADGQDYAGTHGEDTGEVQSTETGGANIINTQTLGTSFASLSKGDFCGIKFTRHGTDANDTLDANADVYLFGFLLTYTAEQ